MTDYTIAESNRQLSPGSYTADDTVTFTGTRGNDTLFGGGGEGMTTFLGTAGNDLYGVAPVDFEAPDWALAYSIVDYSSARSSVYVDMTFDGGTRTFVDDEGETRTVEILGIARDGLGGWDSFAALPGSAAVFGEEVSGIYEVVGSRFADVIIGNVVSNMRGGAGNDQMLGSSLFGDAGNDRLILRGAGDWSTYGAGGDGDDFLWGTDGAGSLLGGAGNDHIFARGGDDDGVIGEAGNDYVDGGAGDDFIDGGVGRDVLVSGAGNDRINPDIEGLRGAGDGAADTILVTRADLGAYTDRVVYFEDGIDQIRFGDAVKGGLDFRVSKVPDPFQPAKTDTLLQIDQNRDGAYDANDYALYVYDSDLSLHGGYLLT